MTQILRHARFGLLVALVGCRQFPSASSAPPSTAVVAALAVDVHPSSVAPLGAANLVVTGGYPPYALAFAAPGAASGAGATVDSSGDYVAGPIGPVEDRIQVSDADGGHVLVTIDVGLQLALVPAAAEANPGATVIFTAESGEPPYQFTLQSSCASADGGRSGSTLQSSRNTAIYAAGTLCANTQDSISVRDANDAGAGPVLITIGSGVTLFPPQADAMPGETLAFAASGGVPPYTFAFAPHGNRSGGSITIDGAYQAGPNPTETDFIQAMDGQGLVGQAQVAIGNVALSLATPESFALYPAKFGTSTGLVALTVASNLGVASGTNLVEILLGSPEGVLPLTTQQLTPVPASLMTADENQQVNAELIYASTPSLLGAASLNQLTLGSGGGLVPGASETPSPFNDFGYATVYAVDDTTLYAALQLGSGTDGGSLLSIVFYELNGSGAAAQFQQVGVLSEPQLGSPGTSQPPFFPGIHSIAGRKTTLALISDSPDPATDCTQLQVVRMEGIEPLSDGGVQVATVDSNTEDTPYTNGLNVCLPPLPCLGPLVGVADLDGDGTQDIYVYTACPLDYGTLDVWLSRPDGGSERQYLADGGLLRMPPGIADARSTPLGLPPPSPDAIDVVGIGSGVRLLWDGTALIWVDGGFPAGSASLAYEDLNGDGVTDLALASDQGQLTIERGEILGQRGTGDAFLVPGLREDANPYFVSTGDVDGDGIADLLVGWQQEGLTLLAGAGPELLSYVETPLSAVSDQVLTTVGTPGASYALAQPLGEPAYLARVGPTDGGVGLWKASLDQLPFVPNRLWTMTAGGTLGGGDVLVSDVLPTRNVNVQAYAFNGQTLTAVPSLSLQTDGGAALIPSSRALEAFPVNATGASIDDLAVVVEDLDGLNVADVDLVLFPAVASPPSWSPSGSLQFRQSSLVAAGNSTCGAALSALSILPPIVPVAYQVGQRPQAVVIANSGVTCVGTTSCGAACLFDLSNGVATPMFAPVGGQGLQSATLFVGDFNGDGLTDILAAGTYGAAAVTYSVVYGAGDGGFSSLPQIETLPVSPSILIGAGDFDGDGRTDLIFANTHAASSPSVAVLRSVADGGFD